MTTKRRRNVETGSAAWNGWHVEIDWTLVGGVPTPVALRLEQPGAEPLTSSLLRGLPFGRLARETRTAVAQQLQRMTDELLASVEDAPTLTRYIADRGAAMQQPYTSRKTAGRDLGDDVYREVAAVYSSALAAGRPDAPPAPTQAVMEHFSLTNKSAAARRVREARRRGYLPGTSRGRIGPITEEQP